MFVEKEYLEEVVELLRKGGIILYPTDTVWGIGCDSTNDEAIAKIYALKEREEEKSMLVIMDSLDRVSLFFDNPPTVAWELLEMSDKPLTLILDKPKGVSTKLISSDGSLAMRIADHDFCKAVIRKLGKPLVSTSANISGEPSPLKFSQISEKIKSGVDMVIDTKYEGTQSRKPSSIIKLTEDLRVTIIRE